MVWGAIPVAALAVMMSINHVPGTNISLAVPYAAEGPGPMFNTLGEVEGEPVIASRALRRTLSRATST